MHYDKILSFMESNKWYKTSNFVDILDVKERRIKILLNELVEKGLLVEDGLTKGKKYKKIDKQTKERCNHCISFVSSLIEYTPSVCIDS